MRTASSTWRALPTPPSCWRCSTGQQTCDQPGKLLHCRMDCIKSSPNDLIVELLPEVRLGFHRHSRYWICNVARVDRAKGLTLPRTMNMGHAVALAGGFVGAGIFLGLAAAG